MSSASRLAISRRVSGLQPAGIFAAAFTVSSRFFYVTVGSP
jgi:hypothetical protein